MQNIKRKTYRETSHAQFDCTVTCDDIIHTPLYWLLVVVLVDRWKNVALRFKFASE